MQGDITLLQTRVTNLENSMNSGGSNVNLTNRVSALETAVGNLQMITTNYIDVSSALTSLSSEVTAINDRLRWHELSNES